MPLINSKSKKAMSKNIATEMDAGKPQKQSIAIAYNIKRKAHKKMADGGSVSAKSEKRPMPDDVHDDAKMVSHNSGKKPAGPDSWTDNPTMKQARKGPRITPLKRPSMVPTDAFSTRMWDEEDDLQDSAGVNNGPQEQPPEHDNEEDADKSGPDTPSLHMKLMAEGGEVNEPMAKIKGKDTNKFNKAIQGASKEHGERDAVKNPSKIKFLAEGGKTTSKNHGGMDPGDEDDDGQALMAKGGMAEEYGEGPEEDNVDEPMGLESDDDMMGDEDDFMGNAMAPMLAMGGDVYDMDSESKINYTDRPDKGYGAITFKAKGGDVEGKDSLDTLVDAVMKRMQKKASGGMVDIDENGEEQPNYFYKRNEDEALKENYDSDLDDMTYASKFNEHGDEQEKDSENQYDMVDAVRKKMAKKRAFR